MKTMYKYFTALQHYIHRPFLYNLLSFLGYGVYHTVINAHAPHFVFFFFNDTATTEIYTLSLHDALPICGRDLAKRLFRGIQVAGLQRRLPFGEPGLWTD